MVDDAHDGERRAPERAAPAPLPRWVTRLLLVGGTLGVLFVGRVAVSFGVATHYYATTASFGEFVDSTPVAPEVAERWLPEGSLLAENEPLVLGEPADFEDAAFRARARLNLKRGDQVLLDAFVEFDVVGDEETWEPHGLRISLAGLHTPPGMRAFVQVGLIEPEALLDHDDPHGRVFVDALLLAGDGPVAFRVVEYESPPPPLAGGQGDRVLDRLVMGWVHPDGEPPEEGYIHHLRCQVEPQWIRLGANGYMGPHLRGIDSRTNSPMYSRAFEAELEDLGRESAGTNTTQSTSITYTWNDVVW